MPGEVMAGFDTAEVNPLGPVQPKLTPDDGVKLPLSEISGLLQANWPTALAVTTGSVLLEATSAVSVPEQPVAGLVATNV